MNNVQVTLFSTFLCKKKLPKLLTGNISGSNTFINKNPKWLGIVYNFSFIILNAS